MWPLANFHYLLADVPERKKRQTSPQGALTRNKAHYQKRARFSNFPARENERKWTSPEILTRNKTHYHKRGSKFRKICADSNLRNLSHNWTEIWKIWEIFIHVQIVKTRSIFHWNLKNLRDFHLLQKPKSTFYLPLKSEKSARFPLASKTEKNRRFNLNWNPFTNPGQEIFQKPGLQKFQGNLPKPGPLKFYKITQKSTHHPHQEIMKVGKPGPLKF